MYLGINKKNKMTIESKKHEDRAHEVDGFAFKEIVYSESNELIKSKLIRKSRILTTRALKTIVIEYNETNESENMKINYY